MVRHCSLNKTYNIVLAIIFSIKCTLAHAVSHIEKCKARNMFVSGYVLCNPLLFVMVWWMEVLMGFENRFCNFAQIERNEGAKTVYWSEMLSLCIAKSQSL